VIRHATKAQLADGRHVLGPGALDADAVAEAVDAGAGRFLRVVERTERRVCRSLADSPTTPGRAARLIDITTGRRAEHEVIEQIDLADDAEIVRDVQLGVQTEADVGPRLRLVLARRLGAVAGLAAFVRRAERGTPAVRAT
jgi:hypothetical protein